MNDARRDEDRYGQNGNVGRLVRNLTEDGKKRAGNEQATSEEGVMYYASGPQQQIQPDKLAVNPEQT